MLTFDNGRIVFVLLFVKFDMRGTASSLMRFLDGSGKRFIIPVYQRNYDWKKENCQQLFDDLVSVIKEKKDHHFFGSIVSAAHGRDEIVLIDGQQRITTVSLILIALRNALKRGVLMAEDHYLIERIDDYLIDKYDKSDRKVRLKPFRDDCTAFDNLLFRDESEYIGNSKVTINYRYFYDRIVTIRELTPDELFLAIKSLEIIDIELEPEHGDNPQLIFESLNSTGLDLSEADKIRNFVLMNLAPDVQENYYDLYWNKIERNCHAELDGFVRNYLTVKQGVIPNLKSIYTSFKAYARTVNDILAILQDMLTYAYTYNDIVTHNVGSDETNEVAERLDLLDMTVAYPFLMAFLVYAKQNQIEEKEVYTVLSCVETFIFRRLMCDLPTNALNKIFATLHTSVLKNKKDTDTYSSVMIYILESKKLSSSFPKDEEFQAGFTTKNIYSMRAKNKEYIFERLENGNSKEKQDVVGNIEKNNYTIEHIMPQTLSPAWKQELGENWEAIQERWLHTIANLTLTAYNSNYSNKLFSEKKTMEHGFLESGIRMNHYIASFDKWSEDELEQRKKHLQEEALKIWAYPETSFVPVAKEDDVVSLSEDNGISTGREIQYFIFRENRQDVNQWSDMMWEMGQILYTMNPAILYQEAANRKNVWFETFQCSHNYRKLAEGLFFCPTSSSTWNKMAILKNLFKLYGIDEDDLSFGLKPKKEGDEEYYDESGNRIAPRYQNRKEFWTDFIQYSTENDGLFVNLLPVSGNWISKTIKVPYGVKMDAVVRYDNVRIELYFDSGDEDINKPLFDYLFSKKEDIEAEYGAPLIWQRMSDRRACRIKDEIACRPFETEDKTAIFKFMKDASDKMSAVFAKYILKYKNQNDTI